MKHAESTFIDDGATGKHTDRQDETYSPPPPKFQPPPGYDCAGL